MGLISGNIAKCVSPTRPLEVEAIPADDTGSVTCSLLLAIPMSTLVRDITEKSYLVVVLYLGESPPPKRYTGISTYAFGLVYTDLLWCPVRVHQTPSEGE
jgi:hypothetical protein